MRSVVSSFLVECGRSPAVPEVAAAGALVAALPPRPSLPPACGEAAAGQPSRRNLEGREGNGDRALGFLDELLYRGKILGRDIFGPLFQPLKRYSSDR